MKREELYSEIPGKFYEDSLNRANPLTRYYHRNRYEKIRKFITPRFKKRMKILDIGCGSSSWNSCKLPVTGLDINEKMLEYGKSKGYLKNAVIGNLIDKLPVKDESFDFVIISEVLEHLVGPEKTIHESWRVLKKSGILIVTVPLDTTFSPWKILFGIGCFIRGNILGNEYYRNNCGHIQHFSVKKLEDLLKTNGFKIIEKNITILNIGIIAQKVS
ncbi:methyltransferase domain-containing protein [Candidatus Micrarchaeota archaeon]|nr:methyltransferase domain-containing protein [Candidatus Micrarchaeota archaeon]